MKQISNSGDLFTRSLILIVPVLPFLPHAKRDQGVFAKTNRPQRDTLNNFEGWWKTPVELILFLFALTNAGVPFSGVGLATWIVLVALVLGKPLGIMALTALSEIVGLTRPVGLQWKDILVLSLAAGIGFTVALFFTTAAFPLGAILDAAKLGALLSVLAAVPALGLARIMGVGRMARSTDALKPPLH